MGQGSRLKLIKLSAKLVGRNFAVGFDKYEAGEGLDCFTLIIEYLRLRGKKITGEEIHLGYKVKDYLKPYEESQVKGIGLATSFFETFLEPVQVNFSRPGDILVLKNKKVKFDLVHFGIECANSQVIVALNKKSVEVLDKKYFDVIGAYTWAGK